MGVHCLMWRAFLGGVLSGGVCTVALWRLWSSRCSSEYKMRGNTLMISRGLTTNLDEMFDVYDKNCDGVLEYEEIKSLAGDVMNAEVSMLQEIAAKLGKPNERWGTEQIVLRHVVAATMRSAVEKVIIEIAQDRAALQRDPQAV